MNTSGSLHLRSCGTARAPGRIARALAIKRALARPAAARSSQQPLTTCVASPPGPSAAASSSMDHPTAIHPAGLPRTAVVGVLGGGQLGKMLGQEAVGAPQQAPLCARRTLVSALLQRSAIFVRCPLQAKMGIKLKVLDPTPNCPASAVAEQVRGRACAA